VKQTANQSMPLWRCEFKDSSDKNLIAKFFRASSAQDAVRLAKSWHGVPVTIIVTQEKE
jgi:hypothetical protein